METLRTPLLNWPYYYQGKSIEELKHSLICTTLELETTKLAAQEEIRKREEQLTHLQELLNKAITEKNEAQENCKTLLLEKLYIQQQQQMVPPQSIISSPSSPLPLPLPLQPSPSALSETALTLLTPKKPLPEKGKLLQAVIKAGPLLQTLLLAGPLPQWRHPPPPLENFDIPPVTIPAAAVTQPELVHQQEFLPNVCGNVNRKRGFSDGFSSEASKYQRVLLH
uniref:Uncharacterized protein n=1 Tax=Chenopodium quinoa TaxID=63459 RepID=A0A803MGS5_CHEQI